MAKKPFAIEYQHKGKRRNLRMEAESFEDAMAQISAAYHNGEPYQVRLSIPLPRWFFGGK